MANTKKIENGSKSKKKKRIPSMTKRIRDVRRLLAKDNLDPKMRQVMEKRLAALLEESAENKRKFKERKYAIRYHRIRFFERVKLERSITKIKRELANAPDAEKMEGLRSMLAQAEDDLEYVLHFPKGEKYVSILKNSQDDPEAQKILELERKRLRILVKKQLEDEAIVNEMDEGKSRAPIPAKDTSLASKRPMGDGAEESMGPIVHQTEDMADDDFFLTGSRSSGESEDKYESDQISQESRPPSSSSQEEQPIDSKATACREAHSAPKHNNIIQESKEPRISPKNVIPNRKPHKVARSKTDVSRQHSRIPAGGAETKVYKNTAKLGHQVDSKRVSKDKAAGRQPLRTRADGGRKRRKKG